jgi:hypothetical protein
MTSAEQVHALLEQENDDPLTSLKIHGEFPEDDGPTSVGLTLEGSNIWLLCTAREDQEEDGPGLVMSQSVIGWLNTAWFKVAERHKETSLDNIIEEVFTLEEEKEQECIQYFEIILYN